MKKYVKILALGLFLSFGLSFGIYTVYAHNMPPACSGSSLGIILYTDHPQVREGDTILYSVTIYNGTPGEPLLSCDATGIQASLVTPDGVNHSLTLRRTANSSEDQDYYPNIVSYVSKASDVRAGILSATATVTGTIHQNNTDSAGGGNQQVNVTFIPAPVVIPPSPSPTPVAPPTTGGGSTATTVTTAPKASPTPPPVQTGGAGGGGGGSVIGPTPAPLPIIVNPPLVKIWPKTGFGPKEVKETSRPLSLMKNIRLSIPSIEVETTIEDVDIKKNGEMSAPNQPRGVGMFAPEPGLVVIDGHRGWHEKTAVFDDLHKLHIGDTVYIKDAEGKIQSVFVVKKVQSYALDANPEEAFTSPDDKVSRLNLITCDGDWDSAKQTYTKRLVVFTEEVK